MATINLDEGRQISSHVNRSSNVTVPYVVERKVDLAVATARKGSTLAATDEIFSLLVPAGSLVLIGGATVAKKSTDGTTASLSFGPTGGSALVTVNTGSDNQGNIVASSLSGTLVTTDTWYTVKVGAVTSGTADAPTDGEVRVWLAIVDVSQKAKPGLAS